MSQNSTFIKRSGFSLLVCFFLLSSFSFAQLSGSKFIPGDYATIGDAVTALNSAGVGPGGVIFNVAAGHTENVTAPIVITATGTAGNTIWFQKNGAGANPRITRTDAGTLATSTIGGAGDAVIRIEGTDYITFDGIDVAASDQGIEYGYLTHKPDGINGCQFVTIKNCTVTMTKGTSGYVMGIYIGNGTTSVSSATGVTVTDTAGRNANILITGNTIQNVHAGVYVRGSIASGFYDTDVTIGQYGEGNVIQNFGGGSTTTAYGIYFIYVNNPVVAYNNIINAGGGGTAHGSTLYSIFYSTVSGNVVGSNNNMTVTNAAASSSTYFLYNTNACNSETYENNTFASSGTLPSGSLYFIYSSNTTPVKLINGNFTVGTFDKAGGGTYCYYNAGSPTSGTETITGNTFSNINVASGSSTFYGIYSNTAIGQDRILSNNTVSNINSASTGSHYAIYALSGNNSTVSNNVVSNFTGGGSVYGIYVTGTNTKVYNNTVSGLATTSTGTSVCYGAYSSGGTDVTWYNNFFSDISAPSSTSTTNGACGMYLSGGTNVNLFYNTVFLKYTSLVAGNNSAAVYIGSTSPTTLDMRNNVFVNNVDVTVGTRAMAIRKGGTALTNLSANTNNNLYYAGVPSATNLIFYDGTNSDQTIADYKGRVSPLESASITEFPPFINTTTKPYNLHMNTTVPTQVEKGGLPVTTPFAITTDFDGELRSGTTPDIGADEFDGLSVDLTPPTIEYTAFGNTSSFSARTLTATITDASGLPTAGIGLPVLYWRINSGTILGITAVYVSGDEYQFTFGSGVAIGDTVSYYICAQDNATTPNVGAVPSSGASGFFANPPAISIPPTNPSFYLITDLPLSGTYTVGLAAFKEKTSKNVYFETRTRTIVRNFNGVDAAEDFNAGRDEKTDQPASPDLSPHYVTVTETYNELMENGKPFDTNFFSESSLGVYPTLTAAIADLNLRGMSGPVTFSLVDAYYANETYPIDIGLVDGASATNTITIKPAVGIQTEIPGSVTQTTATLRVGYGKYVIIDGSNTVGGTTKNLRIVALAAGTLPSIQLYGDAKHNVFKNLIVESQNSSTGSGTFLFGSGPFASDSNLVENCTIKNIDTAAVRPGVGIYFFSSNTGTGNQLVNCTVYDFANYGLRLQGAPTTNTLVSGCDVYMTLPSANTIIYGAYISRVDGLIVEKTRIRELLSTGSSPTVTAVYILGSTISGSYTFRNNFISLSGTTNLTAGTIRGLDYYGAAANSFEAYFNSIYIGGSGVTTGTTSGLLKRDATTSYKAYNNSVYNGRTNGIGGTGKHYAVYVSNTVSTTLEMNNNDYFSDGSGGVLGYWGTADQATLTDWQTASSQDANSVSGNPQYISAENLHIPAGTVTVLESAGTPIAGITTDIDGETRHASKPDIGADEFAGINPASILSGDYYIPQGTSPKGFNTLAEAFTQMNTFGVSGPVRFLIDDNLSETGASLLLTRNDLTETNNLVIKPAPTKTPVITITGCVTTSGATQYSGIALSGASYVTFDGSNSAGGTTRDLTIAMNDSVNGRIGVTLFGNTDFIVFKNMNIKYNIIHATSTLSRGVYANGQASGVADSVIFENCQIGDATYAPAYAISITGSSGSSLYASKIYINNNNLNGIMRPVYFFYGGALGTTSEISNNVIYSPYAPAPVNVVWGILFNTYNGTFNIYNNKLQRLVTATTGSEGIYGIGTLSARPEVVMNIFNNFLGGDFAHNGTGTPSGIDVISFQDNIPLANVYHNTIVLNNLTKTASSRMTGVRWGGTAVVNLKNNIIINDKDAAVAYALYSAGGTFTSNYNDLYVSGTLANIGYWNGAVRQTFQTWQDSTGQDGNSVNVSAPFAAALDFHIPNGTNTPIESGGSHIAWITTDIDGDTRSSVPDIGADEFAGISLISAPSDLIAIADTHFVSLSWTDNSNNEIGFVIERRLGDTTSVNPFIAIDTVGADVVSYVDTTGILPLTTYNYRLYAYNASAASGYSNIVQTTTIIPVEFVSFNALVSEKSVRISWSTATEINNRGFEIQRSMDGDWSKIGFIQGKGTTTEMSEYTFVDKFDYDSYKGNVSYRLKQMDFDGTFSYSKVISVDIDFTPTVYTLYQNYPNPFNPSTTIKFALPYTSTVRVSIFNLLGELVEVLADEIREAGYHNVVWNAGNMPSGLYVYTIEAKSQDGTADFKSVKKMMLVK